VASQSHRTDLVSSYLQLQRRDTRSSDGVAIPPYSSGQLRHPSKKAKGPGLRPNILMMPARRQRSQGVRGREDVACGASGGMDGGGLGRPSVVVERLARREASFPGGNAARPVIVTRGTRGRLGQAELSASQILRLVPRLRMTCGAESLRPTQTLGTDRGAQTLRADQGYLLGPELGQARQFSRNSRRQREHRANPGAREASRPPRVEGLFHGKTRPGAKW
jgi:hypothetical protein